MNPSRYRANLSSPIADPLYGTRPIHFSIANGNCRISPHGLQSPSKTALPLAKVLILRRLWPPHAAITGLTRVSNNLNQTKKRSKTWVSMRIQNNLIPRKRASLRASAKAHSPLKYPVTRHDPVRVIVASIYQDENEAKVGRVQSWETSIGRQSMAVMMELFDNGKA